MFLDYDVKLISALTLLLLLSFLPSVQAEVVDRELCVFDIGGKNGPVFNRMKEFQTAALEWGVRLKLTPYTDEKVAVEDFQAGECDAVSLTGVRNRDLVKFAGSLDMMGGLQTYDHMKKTIKVLSRPKAREYLRNEHYETVAIFPGGKVFLFVRPGPMSEVEGTPTVKDLAGKRVAALSHDEQALTLIRHVGASPVPANITSFAGKFNNGSVDVAYAPAAAYEILELYKGLGEKGAVIDYTLAQLTYQITVRRSKFPDDFGVHAMDYAVEKFDEIVDAIAKAENTIPDKYWVDIPEEHKVRYNGMFRNVRQRLVKKGIYDPRMVKLLRKIRCSFDPSLAECTM